MGQIKFLGTGGAFDVEQGNSSVIVDHPLGLLLVDCGHSVFPKLVQTGLVGQIQGVLLTHLHDDHCGSLTTFLYYRKYVLGLNPLLLFTPDAYFAEIILDWMRFSVKNPETLVKISPLSSLDGANAIDTTGLHVEGMPSWGYSFSFGKNSIVYSGDCGDPDSFLSRVQKLQLPSPIVFHEIFFGNPISGHTHYKRLMDWEDRFRIMGYHCNPNHAPVDNTIPLVANFRELLV